MRSAFLLVVPDRAAPLPPTVEELLAGPHPPHGAFAAPARLRWQDTRGHLRLAAWQEEATPLRWKVRERDVSALTGEVRRVGRAWGDETTWPDVVDDLLAEPTPGSLDALTGIFAAVATLERIELTGAITAALWLSGRDD